jgi:hypothetical protein
LAFEPQQYPTCATVTPQELKIPAERCAKVSPPLTATGVKRKRRVPSPFVPKSPVPQHQADPAVESAHPLNPASEISVKVKEDAMGFGVSAHGTWVWEGTPPVVPVDEQLSGALGVPSAPDMFLPQQ